MAITRPPPALGEQMKRYSEAVMKAVDDGVLYVEQTDLIRTFALSRPEN